MRHYALGLMILLIPIWVHATPNCEFLLTHTRDLSAEMGVVLDDDNRLDFFSVPHAHVFVVHEPTSLNIFTDNSAKRITLPEEYANYEMPEISGDLNWARLVHAMGPHREIILNLQTMLVAKSADISDDEFGLITWHLVGDHSLLEIDSNSRTIAIFDLNREPKQAVATAQFVAASAPKVSDVMAAMGFDEVMKWQAHFEEGLGTLYLVPLGDVENPKVIRFSTLDRRLKAGLSFELPVPEGIGMKAPPQVSMTEAKKASLSNPGSIPPEVIKAILQIPTFEISSHEIGSVRFSGQEFIDFATFSTIANTKMTSTLQRFSLVTGQQIFKLDLPSGFRVDHFIIDPMGKFAVATGDRFNSDHDGTDRTQLLVLAQVDPQEPMVIKEVPLSELIPRGAGRYEPFIVQSIWKNDEVILLTNDLQTYTFKVQ